MADDAILRPSIMDRLSASAPGGPRAALEGVSAADLKRSVARDLEWLLNTRIWTEWNLDALEESRRSIMNYGIPELSTYSWNSADDARKIRGIIEAAIRTFEPRLASRSVTTEVVPSKDVSDFTLRIRIEALLEVDPISEPVTFETGLDFEGGGLRVERFE